MSKKLIIDWAKKQNSIVIDGAMSLGLEERQVNLNNKLWTASAIDYYPEKKSKMFIKLIFMLELTLRLFLPIKLVFKAI